MAEGESVGLISGAGFEVVSGKRVGLNFGEGVETVGEVVNWLDTEGWSDTEGEGGPVATPFPVSGLFGWRNKLGVRTDAKAKRTIIPSVTSHGLRLGGLGEGAVDGTGEAGPVRSSRRATSFALCGRCAGSVPKHAATVSSQFFGTGSPFFSSSILR